MLTTKQAAVILQTDRHYVWRLWVGKKIKGEKIGRDLLLDTQSVEDYAAIRPRREPKTRKEQNDGNS